MNLALTILSRQSAAVNLYAEAFDGVAMPELTRLYGLSEVELRERLEATRLALRYQVQVDLNPQSSVFAKTIGLNERIAA